MTFCVKMKILAIGDLHGRMPKIHFKNFDAIVQVGDVCSDKDFRPLKDKWLKEVEKNPKDAPNLHNYMIGQVGKKKFNLMIKHSLERGREILKYLNSFNKPVFIVPGNWDQSEGRSRIKEANIDKSNYNYLKYFLDSWLSNGINKKLTTGLKNIKDCQYHTHRFKGVNFVGYGISSNREMPGSIKRLKFNKEQLIKLKESYNKILNKLKNSYEKRDKKFLTVFISHNVPSNTKLDIIKLKKSKYHKKHFGSDVARWFCVRYQPLLCVGGHIHEGKGKDKLKKTTVINVGFGKDAIVLIDLDEKKKKVKNVKFLR